MKAIRIHAYGGPELMQLEDAPVPACGAGDLLVRVVAAGVNPIDWKLRSGVMAAQIPKSFPITLGFDAAGIVTAVGGEVAAAHMPSTWRWTRPKSRRSRARPPSPPRRPCPWGAKPRGPP